MKVIKVSVNEAIGHVLIHNQAGPDGRRVLRKGTILTPADAETLLSLGQMEVYVAVMAEDDIHEDEAARRLGDLLAESGLTISNAATGRVNLIAETSGLFKVDVEGLLAFNDRPAITLATVSNNTPVQPKKVLGTIKIIPYSVPQAELEAAEAMGRTYHPLVAVKPFVV
ncbi:MAG: molybdopterin-binding protein, partial [Anaerolineae bacterium]|nr:molybdopterin-binding protein [Anaerolineae bacterium]